jgi:autophagy-related protein 18
MSKEKINPLELQLTRVCFTNDKSMFCICHDQGFLVCKASPFAILNNRILGGDISIAQMLDNSNIIFLASGGGEKPKYSPTTLVMFNDQKGIPAAQLQIGHRIKNVKVNLKRLFVVGKNKIYLFKTEDLSNVGVFESYEENEEGLCSLSNCDGEKMVFAYPAKLEGYISIMRINNNIVDVRTFYGQGKKLSCLELSNDGEYLLSSTVNGNFIRLFHTQTGDLLNLFRRGKDRAKIFSLSFNQDNMFMCCSSDLGTIHIFKNNEYDKYTINELNRKEKKIEKNILEGEMENEIKMDETKNFAFCRTNEETFYCVFSEKDKIHMISINEGGKYYTIEFDKIQGGEGKIGEVLEILCPENLPHLSS